jgi:hypothetical protein
LAPRSIKQWRDGEYNQMIRGEEREIKKLKNDFD